MNTKALAFMAILLTIGFVLHQFIPGFIFGMKPDMLLSVMFIGILLFPQPKNVLLLGLGAGFISALTTTFPGGQLPNIIDKPITAFAFLGLYLVIRKYNKSVTSVGILTAVGTIISGTIFLSTALIIAGLPDGATFGALFVSAVLTATVFNTVFLVVLYPVIKSIARRTNLDLAY
jgi:hypothetical protein